MIADPLVSAVPAAFRRHMARSSGYVLGGQVLRIASTFTVLVILARQLTRPAYASIVLFFLLVTIGGTVIRCGLPKACVRAIASALATDGREGADRVARTGAVTVGLLALVSLPITDVVVHYLARDVLGDPVLTRLSWLVAGAISVEGYQLTIAEVFRGFHRVGAAVMLGYAARSALLVLAVIALSGASASSAASVLWVYLGCDAVPALVGSVMLVRFTSGSHSAKGRQSVDVARNLLAVGVALAVVEITTFFLTQGDSLVVGAVASHTDTALYNTASRFANLLAIPYFATSLVLPPVVAGLWASGQHGRLERTVRAGAFIGAVPVVVVYAVVAAFGAPIMGAVFGHGYRGAAAYFVILGIGPVLNAATGAAVTVLTMVGEQRLVAVLTVVITCLTLGAEIALGEEFGGVGVAVASALGTIASNVTLSVVAWRRANVRTWLYFRPTAEARSVLRIAGGALRAALRRVPATEPH